MKIIFVLLTTILITGVIWTFSPATLAQSSPPQLIAATPDNANNQAPSAQTGQPYVGVQMVALTPEIAQQMNNDPNFGFPTSETSGILILNVTPDTPAAAADLQKGDIISEVDGQPITTVQQLAQIVANSRIGQSLSFTIRRNSRTIPVSVRLDTAYFPPEEQ